MPGRPRRGRSSQGSAPPRQPQETGRESLTCYAGAPGPGRLGPFIEEAAVAAWQRGRRRAGSRPGLGLGKPPGLRRCCRFCRRQERLRPRSEPQAGGSDD